MLFYATLPQLVLILFFPLTWTLCRASPGLITPAPDIVQRDELYRSSFWLETLGSVAEFTCHSSKVWRQDDTYGGCCSIDVGCWIGTSCYETSSLVLSSGINESTIPCDPGLQCITDVMYEYKGDSDSVSWFACGSKREGAIFYLNSPTATVTSPTTLDSSSLDSSTLDSSTLDSSTLDSFTPNSSTRDPQNESSPNLAWVAGPIIGGVFLALVTGFLIWYIRMRNDNTSKGFQQDTARSTYVEAPGNEVTELPCQANR